MLVRLAGVVLSLRILPTAERARAGSRMPRVVYGGSRFGVVKKDPGVAHNALVFGKHLQ